MGFKWVICVQCTLCAMYFVCNVLDSMYSSWFLGFVFCIIFVDIVDPAIIQTPNLGGLSSGLSAPNIGAKKHPKHGQTERLIAHEVIAQIDWSGAKIH